MAYCKPADHTWVQVVGGKPYDPDWDTTVCIICHCYNGVRKPEACDLCGEQIDGWHHCNGPAA